MSTKKRLTQPIRKAAIAAAVLLCSLSNVIAQEGPPPQGVSRGENFSAKPPAQLFASDCTGAGCHKGPQGLAKNAGIGGLAGFLREHYTNSRESAAALASYLAKLPSGPEPKEARTPRTGRAAAAPSAPASEPGWAEKLGVSGPSEAAPAQKREPKEREARTPKQNGRTRAAVRSGEDEPAATRPEPPAVEAPADAPPKAKETTRESARETARETARERAQRGHQQPTAAIAAPAAEPAPAAEAAPAPAATPPAPKQYDIFD